MEDSYVHLWRSQWVDATPGQARPTPRFAAQVAETVGATQNMWPPGITSSLLQGDGASVSHASKRPRVSRNAVFDQGYGFPLKKKRKYKPRTLKNSRRVVCLPVVPEHRAQKKLAVYFRHGNYNSFLRQLNNFGFNKIDAPNASYTLYAKVTGKKVNTITELLALRPRERKTVLSDRSFDGAALDPAQRQLAAPCLTAPDDGFHPLLQVSFRHQTHHKQQQQQQQSQQSQQPWTAARQQHDETTNAVNRRHLFPSEHVQTIQPPEAHILEDQQMLHFQLQQMHQTRQQQQPLLAVQLQQQHQPTHHHDDVGVASCDANISPPHLAYATGDVVDNGPYHYELASPTGSSEPDFSDSAPTRTPMKRAVMSDAEALLSLSGNKNPKKEEGRACARQDEDDTAAKEQHHRLPDVIQTYPPPQKRVAVSPTPRWHITRQRPSSDGGWRKSSAEFPQPHPNEIPAAARLSSSPPSSHILPTERLPQHRSYAPSTRIKKNEYMAAAAALERETHAIPTHSLAMRAVIDELRTCVVCFDKSRACVFADCGHFVLCLSCAVGHSRREVPCPFCRCKLVLDQALPL
ncbi:hypothetical protein CTAYLR_002078 [Chrysophaeum taylorii]|uniref:RING-type domain-containing protein n=1 Tax=Chrysophaeum taylorii TaxID=2483200 RepID=A0AAD7UP02_9STRA|nr:hypothetical protein CTAYLR_002078 [Chrysophaeum taylorii]